MVPENADFPNRTGKSRTEISFHFAKNVHRLDFTSKQDILENIVSGHAAALPRPDTIIFILAICWFKASMQKKRE